MICSTTYRTVLSLTGAVIMTLGTFSMLQASVDQNFARAAARAESTQSTALHSATIDRWQVANERLAKPGV